MGKGTHDLVTLRHEAKFIFRYVGALVFVLCFCLATWPEWIRLSQLHLARPMQLEAKAANIWQVLFPMCPCPVMRLTHKVLQEDGEELVPHPWKFPTV